MAKQVRPVRYDNGESRELNSNEIIAPDYLGTETRTGAKFLRDDGTWQTVAGGAATWGGITGTLSSQSDLQSALDDKLDDTQFDGLAKITVGTTTPVGPATGDLWVDTN
jgi:hypothetical protein